MATFKLYKSGHTGEYSTNLDHVICVEGITEQSIVLTVEEIMELSALFNTVVKESKKELIENLNKQKHKHLTSIQSIDQQIKDLNM